MVTRITDPVLLAKNIGADQSDEILDQHRKVVRKHIASSGGREVEHEGNGFIASFPFATRAVECALQINSEMEKIDRAQSVGFAVGLSAGEPIEQSEKIFGDVVRQARYLSAVAGLNRVAVGATVYELVSKDHSKTKDKNLLTFSSQDEMLLQTIFKTLDDNWQDPEFDMTTYCHATIMSKSQLYRKTVDFTGLSPNLLLKEFRLEKALQLLKKKRYSISQITFDSGFTSPSYFTKCFKKKYGLLPMEYVDLLP